MNLFAVRMFLNRLRVTLENMASDMVDVAEAALNGYYQLVDLVASFFSNQWVKLFLVYAVLTYIILFV